MARFAVGLSLVLFLATSSAVFAQTDPGGGILPFSTNKWGVDLATSHVFMSFPLRSKPGKIPFSSAIVGTSYAYPLQNPGETTMTMVSNLVGVGIPPSSLMSGFQYTDPAQVGLYVTQQKSPTCIEYVNPIVYDHTGAQHPFPSASWGPCSGITHLTAVASDGSGYTLVVTNSTTTTVYDKSGRYVTGGNLAANPTLYDPDGATIQDTIASNSLTVTDTLGVTVLTGTGSAPQYTQFSYNDENGNSQNYVLSYTQLNIATNFQCGVPSWTTEYVGDMGPGTASVLTGITTPTGAQYVISYEKTKGISGSYTGRIGSITLPTGGSITYSYSGGSNNAGFDCNSFVVPKLQVKVNDINGNNGTYTYVNSNDGYGAGQSFTVTETDPAGNQTVYTFQGEYQTQAVYYQGTSTVLRTVLTCYNGNTSNCVTPSPEPVPPSMKLTFETVSTTPHPATLSRFLITTLRAESPTETYYQFQTTTTEEPLPIPPADFYLAPQMSTDNRTTALRVHLILPANTFTIHPATFIADCPVAAWR
ncbi:MAG TPA: hypothetical protein VF753_17145 [Terriglobales bacterium]